MVVGNITMAFSGSFRSLLLGRLLTGLAYGLMFSSVPSYTPEIMQPSLRGYASTFNTCCYMIGLVMTYYVKAIVGSWRILLYIMASVPGLCFIGVMTIPESPVWCCKKARHQDAAKVNSLIDLNKVASAINLDK